ncbi:MAG TPA: hypothetical protein VJ789_00560 [Burkholderiales bacterium]|nr:hypothetical protein [Burkholderiales bacterium]
MKTLSRLLFATLLFLNMLPASAAELGARSSSAAGVTVKVTPKDVSPQAAVWTFAVVLDTHSQDLRDDLATSTALVDARGGRHAPLAWEGAAPGGHHRAGVLRFKGLGVQADAIELQIHRAGEQAPRVYRWKLK